ADVIEHLPAAWDALASYARALRPGGWVIVSVPTMRSAKVFAERSLRGAGPAPPPGIFDATPLQVMTRKRLLRWASAAGLSLEASFDAYLSQNRFGPLLRIANLATLKLFNEFWMVQIQARFRRVAPT